MYYCASIEKISTHTNILVLITDFFNLSIGRIVFFLMSNAFVSKCSTSFKQQTDYSIVGIMRYYDEIVYG